MEITPTPLDFQDGTQEFQDTVVDETIPQQAEAQYNSTEFETPEDNADGDQILHDAEGTVEEQTGGSGDASAGGGAINHHSIYLAGGMVLPKLDAFYLRIAFLFTMGKELVRQFPTITFCFH
jgi:hypothetical protein